MTTPEPRVRVAHVPWENFAFPWVRQCDGCKERTGYWLNQPAAVEDARIHAMECDSLRLAWLVRELETLRDRLDVAAECDRNNEMLRTNTRYGNYLGGLINARIGVVRDLTAIIDRAGGTGC